MIEFEDLALRPAALSEVHALYLCAFPPNERVPFPYLLRKARQGRADFFALRANGVFCGLLYQIPAHDRILILFFAVAPAQRGRGLGSRVLARHAELFPGKRVLLNIEDPSQGSDRALRQRRRDFYLRNGFTDARIKTREHGVVYDMLCRGGGVTYAEYSEIVRRYMGRLLFALYYRQLAP